MSIFEGKNIYKAGFTALSNGHPVAIAPGFERSAVAKSDNPSISKNAKIKTLPGETRLI